MPHNLFRYTSYIDTRSANSISFDQSNFCPMHSRTVSRSNPTASSANCNIIIMFTHFLNPCFLCNFLSSLQLMKCFTLYFHLIHLSSPLVLRALQSKDSTRLIYDGMILFLSMVYACHNNG